MVRCSHVDQREAHAQGLAIRLAHHAHHSADRLQYGVAGVQPGVGALLPEAGDGAVDDAGPERLAARVIETQLRHHAGAVVRHHHVGLRHQAFDDTAAFRGVEIDADVALAAVERNVLRIAKAARLAAAGTALPVAFAALDLDHLRAHVTEQRGGVRSGNAFGHVDHPDA